MLHTLSMLTILTDSSKDCVTFYRLNIDGNSWWHAVFIEVLCERSQEPIVRDCIYFQATVKDVRLELCT